MNHTFNELLILLEIFNVSLKNSSEKTVGITNSIISYEIKNIMTNSSFNDLINEFGEQFDSLSDLVTFAMAPSIIFYKYFLTGLGRVGLVVSFFFCLCGALRLARFNANIGKVDSNFFQGLPSPVAAAAVIGAIFFSLEYTRFLEVPSWLAAVYLTFYALMMISSIPFPSFKNSPWVVKNKKKSLIFILLVLLLIILNEEIMLISVISLYVMSSLIYAYKNRNTLMSSIIEEDDCQE